MGHSHIQTTARYLHAKSQAGDAALLAGAFAANTAGTPGVGETATAPGSDVYDS